MVALPMEDAHGLPQHAAAAPRATHPAGRLRGDGNDQPADGTSAEAFGEPDTILQQLGTARRRVAASSALLIVFGTLSGGLLGAHLPKAGSGIAVATPAQNCGITAEFNQFIP